MKNIILLFLFALGGGAYYLHSKELLDDLPYMVSTLTKPAHERPVHHFYYGLKNGELLFTGMALDKTAIDNLSSVEDMSASEKKQLKQLLQNITCQLEFKVLDSAVQGEKATVNIRIRTVPPVQFLKSLTGSAITGLFSKTPAEDILLSLRETGCLGKTKEMDQQFELHKEDGQWKICSECAGKDLMLELLYQTVRVSL